MPPKHNLFFSAGKSGKWIQDVHSYSNQNCFATKMCTKVFYFYTDLYLFIYCYSVKFFFRFTTIPLSLSPGCRNLQDIPHVQPPEQRKVKISTAMVKSRQTKSLKFTKVAWKVLHLDSFWQRGTRELGNGLFMGSFFGLHSACFSLNYHVRSCVQFSAHCK